MDRSRCSLLCDGANLKRQDGKNNALSLSLISFQTSFYDPNFSIWASIFLADGKCCVIARLFSIVLILIFDAIQTKRAAVPVDIMWRYEAALERSYGLALSPWSTRFIFPHTAKIHGAVMTFNLFLQTSIHLLKGFLRDPLIDVERKPEYRLIITL